MSNKELLMAIGFVEGLEKEASDSWWSKGKSLLDMTTKYHGILSGAEKIWGDINKNPWKFTAAAAGATVLPYMLGSMNSNRQPANFYGGGYGGGMYGGYGMPAQQRRWEYRPY